MVKAKTDNLIIYHCQKNKDYNSINGQINESPEK